MNIRLSAILLLASFALALILSRPQVLSQDMESTDWYDLNEQAKSSNIKNVNGKFYAYIVLLFNENPHFVNLIQKDSIPLKSIGNEGFHIREYKNYLKTIKNPAQKSMAENLLSVYLEGESFEAKQLKKTENELTAWNVVLKFSKDRHSGQEKTTLDYCIFGKKFEINVKHPLLKIDEKIYNIQPLIYYDEFSSSNSTFYFDMIYINSEEVNYDSMIARRVLDGEDVSSMFFVGSRVTEDIRYCLQKAFKSTDAIRDEIWKMFVIHELTHKMLNNKYNNFDQITGEELAMSSAIYSNPYLGLSVIYSYLNYNTINPHRIAAMNYIKFIAAASSKSELAKKAGLLRNFSEADIKKYTKEHFDTLLKSLK